MKKIQLHQTSSLYKAFLDSHEIPAVLNRISCLQGEEVSYQIVYRPCFKPTDEDPSCFNAQIQIESELSDLISIRQVGSVPVEMSAYTEREGYVDEDYLRTTPGLYPDPLFELQTDDLRINVCFQHTKSLWVTVRVKPDTQAGIYPITIALVCEQQGVHEQVTMELEVIDAVLPEQELIVTQWLHTDCLSTYYRTEVFSERYWEIVEQFIKTAVDNGINMILTPIITPPLDTEIGGERPTVQLVDIACAEGVYHFGFEKLDRWIDICNRNGVKYFEMAHLFSQWGAEFAPKVVVYENGEYIKKFGWHTAATSESYAAFLNQFLPALTAYLKRKGIADRTYFHISDEPHQNHRETYAAAKSLALPHLQDFKIIDCFSDFSLFGEGLVRNPIVGIYRIHQFIDNQVENLWVYYCCSHTTRVSNRFLSMPSARNRVIGLQMYKYKIEGFLQWGYNFYYSQLSRYPINPYISTDAGNGFPSGDAFSVYPGDDKPVESLRLKVFHEALQDMRAMKLLEQYMDREDIIKAIENVAGMEIDFFHYPKGEAFILNTRETINKLIKQKIGG